MIVGLERLLDRREHWRRADPGRDPLRYWTRVFGRPSSDLPWGWRFEGHHVALHFTLHERRVVSPTPTFFGANPAESPLVGGKLRPLGPLEDVARELVCSLDEEQRVIAVVSPEAPPDLLTGSAPHVAHTLMPLGLRARSMRAAQRSILEALVELYVSRLPEDVAETERGALRERGMDELAFAWAGSLERKRGHYYRVQDARFLVEYDNTQNDANHVHTVWRDPANDFGVNVLAAHYARHPH